MNKSQPLLNIPQPPNSIAFAQQQYQPVFQEQPDDDKVIRAKNRQIGKIFRNAIIATIIFWLLSQPFAYKISHTLAQYILSSPFYIINDEGCATAKGSGVHALLFFVIVFILML
jgi:hypothetical protein